MINDQINKRSNAGLYLGQMGKECTVVTFNICTDWGTHHQVTSM